MRAAIPLISVLTLLARPSQSAVTVCSAAGNATCAADGKNLLCVNTDGVEDCGYCLPGYIRYKEECYWIDDINFTLVDEFIVEYAPQLTSNATSELRALFLEKICRVISFWRTQIPPPAFQLDLNLFSLDSLQEVRQRLGYTYLPGLAASVFPRWNVEAARKRKLRALQQPEDDSLPLAVDHVKDGALTAIKDQGRCGCCWAVSTMTAVESAAYLTPDTGGFLQSLSFQQLISCDTESGNQACNGGNILLAMRYAWKNDVGGVATLNDYPYTDKEGSATKQCLVEDKQIAVRLRDPRVVLSTGDNMDFEARRDRMKLAVSIQPVVMVLRSNCDLISSYSGGVLTTDGACACSETSCIDHAVVLVGYNDTAEIPYWKLRNSWSTRWGEDGYFRIAQEGGGKWGLFGMLAEAAIPLDAYNSTGAVEDLYEEDDGINRSGIILVVLAGVLILCCICGAYMRFTQYYE